jgi:hypothetical protein
VARLAALLRIHRRTLVRWRRWCSSTLRVSRFWDSLRGRFMPAVDEATMPASLLSRMMLPDDEPVVVTLLALAGADLEPAVAEASAT